MIPVEGARMNDRKSQKEEYIMKKALNCSMVYAVAGLAAGVYYREFTKILGFSGSTVLAGVHTHLLVLGMMMFMLVALFAQRSDLGTYKSYRVFMITYNAGVALTSAMMLVRGTLQVLGSGMSSGISAAISGMAGIGHMLLGTGMILLLVALKKTAR